MKPLLELTVGELLKESTKKFGHQEAVIYSEQNIRYTYAEFYKETSRVAKALLATGLKKGDHIAIWATNVPEWLLLQFAAARIGAVLVTLNTSYQSSELEYVLSHSDTTALFFIDEFKSTSYTSIITGIEHNLPKLKHLINLSGSSEHTSWNEFLMSSLMVSNEVLDKHEQSLHTHEVINMQYTSGTTGFPKGVMLSHHNIVNNGFLVAQSMKLTNEDRLCIPVPFFHCFGCVLGVLACVSVGATMLPIIEFQPASVLRTVEKEKCTALHGVPTMFISELNALDFKQYDLSTLRTGIMAGSNCPAEVMKRVINEMGITEITIAYGQTETSPVITQTTPTDSIERRVQTVGKVHNHVQIQIINPVTGKQASFGEQGELCAKGYLTMKGYYKMPEETEKTIVEGWLHTGDLATIDKDGYVKISGRLKDMIIRGGENIYPREIEEFLYRIPEVEDVQIVGIPDPKYGERVAACIKLKQNSFLTAQEIKDFCKGKLAHFKIPEHIYFIDDFPMTASGKIQKYKLKEEIVALYK
ncbi:MULTISPECIES: AMP-binding protein [Priestia]|uniref:AMP-binding protein n=1 Tax=Priestia TaxID=2800373 RepID=UPI00203C6E1F|nr:MULTISPECIES: AMP-binding protein [Priestia]MCM3773298.1 AMP-binding protein [Priestia aryabhattai]MDY0942197.1 AMP-binding protein [Priestia megaterium]